MEFDKLYFYFEFIGTVAFAISGVIVGIDRKMDVFGNIVLALMTAVGGGILRDLILGITPPSTLKNPFSALVALITAIVFMILFSLKHQLNSDRFLYMYRNLMLFSDSIGLGIFTVIGVNVGIKNGFSDNIVILVLAGTLTGVGGGMVRDMMAGMIPSIFTKNIYAVSCIIGAIIYISILDKINMNYSILIGATLVFIIRVFSEIYKLNLPKIE